MCSHLMKTTQRSMTRGKALAISVANSVVDSGKCWIQTRWASSNVTSYVVPTILNPESMGIYKWIFSKLDGNLSNSKMQVSLGISYNWGKLKPMLRWSEWSYWEEYISFRCNCRSPNAWRSRSQADWRGEAVRLSLTTYMAYTREYLIRSRKIGIHTVRVPKRAPLFGRSEVEAIQKAVICLDIVERICSQ